MSLNPTHENEIAKYIQYFHKKRTEMDKELKTITEEFADGNLNEDLYNKDDVGLR